MHIGRLHPTCLTACVATLLATQAFGQSWSFVSSPDMFNSDVGDISGGTDAAINAAFPDPAAYTNALAGLTAPRITNGGSNSLTPAMAEAYNALVAQMQANAGGSADTFLIAGDLINGRWPQNSNALINNFGGGNTAGALDNAADIYYTWYRELLRQNGFTNTVAAIGDHDIGDNSWSTGSSRANNVDNMKRAFGRNMVDPLGLPATFGGVSSTGPNGVGEYDEGSYVQQVNNVLFVSVDVFEFQGGGTQLDSLYGAVAPQVTGTIGDTNTHLGWLDAVLTAADSDATVDHVIVQGHTPVLSGVRKQSSSGMMMRNRDDSAFWQVLQAHDHQSGGKVRMYFGGEVHSVTSTKDPESDIVQLVHGNPPIGSGSTNYIVFNVDGDRIEADLYQTNLIGGGGTYYQVSGSNSGGPSGVDPGVKAGMLVIDASSGQTAYETSGLLDFVDNRGLIAHYAFDEGATASLFTNTGSLGDFLYSTSAFGNAATNEGRLGRSLDLDGDGQYARTAGGLAPITEGESRTIAAWVRTTDTGTNAIFGYGQNNAANGEFNLQLANGVLQLNIDSGFTASAANPAINDGEWHHVAVALPGAHENDLGDAQFFVDGVPFAANTANPGRQIRTFGGSASRIHIGANAENLNAGQQFNGLIDDVAMWGSALDPANVRAIVSIAEESQLGFNAAQVETLFDLFDAQQGTASVGGYHWNPASGLSGAGGEVLPLADFRFGVVLDEAGNGVIGEVGLVLTVNRDTGEVLLENLASASTTFDGYSITSAAGTLSNANGVWNSLADQQVGAWVEANPTATRLSELELAEGQTLASGDRFDLGTAFQPTPTSFGESVEDLQFSYVTPDGQELTGLVRYTGTEVNNLALVIDPNTGEARLKNASAFDIRLEGYTITSTDDQLDTDGWQGLQASGEAGWVEVASAAGLLAELNVVDATDLLAGDERDLGDLFLGLVPDGDLELRFWVEGDAAEGRVGRVLFQSLGPTGVEGDYNDDTLATAADYAVWRSLVSQAESLLGGSGDGSGVVDTGDFELWRQRYGQPAASASVAFVPEPSAAMLAAAASIVLASGSRRETGRDMNRLLHRGSRMPRSIE